MSIGMFSYRSQPVCHVDALCPPDAVIQSTTHTVSVSVDNETAAEIPDQCGEQTHHWVKIRRERNGLVADALTLDKHAIAAVEHLLIRDPHGAALFSLQYRAEPDGAWHNIDVLPDREQHGRHVLWCRPWFELGDGAFEVCGTGRRLDADDWNYFHRRVSSQLEALRLIPVLDRELAPAVGETRAFQVTLIAGIARYVSSER